MVSGCFHNKKIRVGIVGCGKIAREKHIPELLNSSLAEITALFDESQNSAEQVKMDFALDAIVYDDFQEIIKSENVDCVYILTPNQTHAPLSISAMRAGKDVMCEKPMAMNSKEAEAVVLAAKETGRRYAVSFQNRFRSDVQRLKNMVDSGKLGDIYFGRAVAIRRRGVPTWGNFLKMSKQGGGPLIDIGVHSIDLALWLMNNYEVDYVCGSVFHKLGQKVNEPNRWGIWKNEEFEVEDSAFGYVRMKNGAVLLVESSWAINRAGEKEACVELSGTNGGADLYDGLRINGTEDGTLTVISYKDFDTNSHSKYSGAGLESETWLNSLRNDTEHCVKPEVAYIVTRIIEAIYLSSETKKPVYF